MQSSAYTRLSIYVYALNTELIAPRPCCLLVADRRRHAHCTQRSLAPRCREDPACAPASCWLLPPPCRVSTLQAACVAHKTPHNALLSAVLWAPPVVATPARGSANGMPAAMSQTTERQEKRVQTVPATRNATDGTGEKHALVQDAHLDRHHLLRHRRCHHSRQRRQDVRMASVKLSATSKISVDAMSPGPVSTICAPRRATASLWRLQQYHVGGQLSVRFQQMRAQKAGKCAFLTRTIQREV